MKLPVTYCNCCGKRFRIEVNPWIEKENTLVLVPFCDECWKLEEDQRDYFCTHCGQELDLSKESPDRLRTCAKHTEHRQGLLDYYLAIDQ